MSWAECFYFLGGWAGGTAVMVVAASFMLRDRD